MKSGPVRVLVADDHSVVRGGIVAILSSAADIEVVGQAGDGAEAARKALETRPDVVILDVNMPGLNGVETARRIHEALPSAGILALTSHEEEEYVVGMVCAGASGYLVKDGAPAALLEAVRALRGGASYFSSRAFQAIVRALRRPPAPEPRPGQSGS